MHRGRLATGGAVEEGVGNKGPLSPWQAEMDMMTWGVDLASVEQHISSHRSIHNAIGDYRWQLDKIKADLVLGTLLGRGSQQCTEGCCSYNIPGSVGSNMSPRFLPQQTGNLFVCLFVFILACRHFFEY